MTENRNRVLSPRPAFAVNATSRRHREHVLLFLQCAVQRQTVARAIKVALTITPILMAVNHWSEIAEGALGSRFILQVVLTFLVPYGVSTFSSARAEMVHRHRQGNTPRTQSE